MAGTRLCLSNRLLLLVAIVYTCGFSSVAAAGVTPRLLRSLAQQDDTFNFDGKEGHPDPESKATPAASEHSDTSTAHTTKEGESKAADPASHTDNINESGAKPHEKEEHKEEHKPEHEFPTVMMLVGPATAGVLAIILIGAVIAFKNRMNKQ